MQNSENNKKVGKHAASAQPPKQPKPAESDFIQDESNLYGDESDIPIRKKKSASSKSEKPTVKIPYKTSKKKRKKHHARKVRKKRRSIIEILTASGEDSFFKPIYLFNKEIRFWPIIVLAFIFLMASGVMLNNSNVTAVEQPVTVVGLPEALEGYQIAVISDLNGKRFGDEQSLLLRTLNNLDYDIIFCVGDMVGKSGDPEPFYEFLDGLSNPGRVYFICGDSDPGPFVEKTRDITGTLSQLVLEDWILGAIERGANYVDAPMCISVKDANLWISPSTMLNLECAETRDAWEEQTESEEDGVLSGIPEDYATLPMTSYRYQQALELYEAQRTMVATDLHIAMAHEPPSEDFIYTAQEHTAADGRYVLQPELIVSGHYCGGVWKLPFLGAFYVPDKLLDRNGWFPEDEKIYGLSTIGETQLYITGGLSTNSDVPLMPFRLSNSPEIAVLTLTSTLPENMLLG
ncbi:MAG: metallophosphoesterase [Clostridiales bacterium]|nr:metallophosphoesterase [Clostridiales bacterium]